MQEIGRKYSIKKRKLVKKTTFSVALLVAITLVCSGSIAGVNLGNTTQENENWQE